MSLVGRSHPVGEPEPFDCTRYGEAAFRNIAAAQSAQAGRRAEGLEASNLPVG